MAKGKKGGSSRGSCKFCNCADCKCKPKLLVALLVALSVLILAPSTGVDNQKSVFSSVLVVEDDTSGGNTSGADTTDVNTTTNGSTDSGAGDSGTDNWDSGSGGGGGCAPGTTCDNNGDTSNTNPPTNNYQPDNTNRDSGSSGGGGCAAGTTCDNGGGGDNWQQGTPSETDCKNDLRDAKRITREIQQVIKRTEKRGEDTTEQTAALETAEEVYAALQSCASLTWEELNQYRETLHGENSVQRQLDVWRCGDERERLEKEIARSEKDPGEQHLIEVRETITGEWVEKIDTQLANMARIREINERKLELMDSTGCKIWSWGEFPDEQLEFDDLNWEQQDLYYGMDEFWYAFQEVQDDMWKIKELDNIEKSITYFLENEYLNLPEDTKEFAYELANTGLALVAKAREASGEELKMIFQKLDELRIKGERLMGKMRPEFNDFGYEENFDQKFEKSVVNMPYKAQLNLVKKILSANPDIMQQIFEGDELLAEKTMRILNKVPENAQAKLLEAKANLGELYKIIAEDNPAIAQYKEDILGYNYVGEPLDELVSGMEDVNNGGTTLDELMSSTDQWQEDSGKLKQDWGVVSFNDYDDSEWYYPDVEILFDEGVVSGKGNGEYAPGDNVTRAEALRMILEKFGEGQSDGTPSFPGSQNHWAKGYVMKAEELGLEIKGDINGPASREEIAKMIIQVTKANVVNPATSSFSDLSTSDPYFGYLETLKELDVVNGDSVPNGLPTVRGDDPINRAEVSKIINRASDNILTEDMLQEFEIDNVINIESSDWEVDFDEDNFGEDNWENSTQGIEGGEGGGGHQPNDNYENDLEDTSDELYDLMDDFMNNVFGALRD